MELSRDDRRKKIKELQGQLMAARIVENTERAKQIKSELEKVAGSPYDRYLDKLNQYDKQFDSPEEPEFGVPSSSYAGEGESEGDGEDGEENQLAESSDADEDSGEPPEEDSKSVGRQALESAEEETATGKRPDTALSEPKKPAKAAAGGAKEQAHSAAKRAAKQVTNQAINALKKVAVQLAKKAVLFLLTNPVGWIIVGALIVALIVVIIFMSIGGGGSNAQPNPRGTTMSRAADPLKDKEILKQVLSMSGAQIGAKPDDFLDQLLSEVTDLKKENPESAISKKAEEVIKLIADFKGEKDAKEEKGDELISRLKELVNLITQIPIMQGVETFSPFVDDKKILKITDTHDGTAVTGKGVEGKDSKGRLTCNAKHHSVFTPLQYCNGTCDAIDMSASKGTEIRASFAGKIIKRTTIYGDVLIIKNDQGYAAVYAHIDSDANKYKEGAQVGAGEKIGTVHDDHLHFELSYTDSKGTRCVTGSPVDPKPVGNLVWNKMKTVLKLP